jgi:hypothetical protein
VEAVLADPLVAVNLSEPQLIQVSSALVQAGKREAAASACGAWLEASAGRGPIAPATARAVVRFLGLDTAGCRAARVRLADHLAQKCLGDATAVRAGGVAVWCDLVGRLSGDLSPEEQPSWAAGLRAAFVDDAAVLETLDLGQVLGLAGALGRVGDPGAAAVAAAWTERTAGWRSLGPAPLASLARGLSSAGDAGKAARGLVAAHVTATFLVDSVKVRSVGCGMWQALAVALGPDLSTTDRSAWAAGVRAAFVEDKEAFAALSLRDLGSLARALVGLGDAQASNLTARWLAETSAWRGLPLRDLASLASALDREGAAGLAVLAAHLAEGCPVEGKPDQLGTWRDLAKRLGPGLTADQGAAWASKLRAAYAGPPGLLEAMRPGRPRTSCRPGSTPRPRGGTSRRATCRTSSLRSARSTKGGPPGG